MAAKPVKSNAGKTLLNDRVFFLALFFLSLLLRIVLSVFPKILTTCPEELYNLRLAQSIREYGRLAINGVTVSSPNILYSLLIAPFCGITDPAGRLTAVSVLNAVLISSALIPAWMLCRELLKKDGTRKTAAVLFVLSPNLWYSGTQMAENLFIPLAMWSFLLLFRLFKKGIPSPGISCAAGLLMYAAYLTSRSGIALIIGTAALYIAETAAAEDRKKAALSAACFPGVLAAAYLGGMFLLFGGKPYHYLTALPDSPQTLFFVLIGAVIILLYFTAGCLLFPVTVPLLRGKGKRGPLQRLTVPAAAYAVTAALLAALYVLPEDFGRVDIRAVLRFLIPAGWLFVLLFLANREEEKDRRDDTGKRMTVPVLILVAAGLILLQVPRTLTSTDAPSLAAAGLAGEGVLRVILTKILPAALALGGLYLYITGKKKALTVCVVALLAAGSILNGVMTLNGIRQEKEAAMPSEAMQDQAEALNRYLDGLDGTVLMVRSEEADQTEQLAATYCDADFRSIDTEELKQLALEAEQPGIIPLNGPPTRIDRADYIVCFDDSGMFGSAQEEEMLPENISCAKVYRNEDPTELDVTDLFSCEPGELIRFMEAVPDYLGYAARGFSHTEEAFTWTEGKEASITVKVKRTTDTPLYLVWELQMTIGEQRCLLYADDQLICEDTLAKGGEYWIPIPEEIAESGEAITFRFEFPDAKAPGNGDPRILAAAFRSVCFEEE